MAENNDIIVRFDKVQKSYDGEILVVKNFNLDIQRGEFLTMLGPSGSGKTTCLMMLAGFEPATHGEIFLNGQPINNVPPHKRGIGMVFQNYALFPHMSVAENLAFPLEVRGMDRATVEAKVNRALDMVRLPEFGNRRPAQLSGGQQQRVAVARALVFEPDLVLMDEPLENLGVSVVYMTHDQSEALTMSNRVAVFDDGVVQQLAAPDVLYEQPVNAFVAGFIGENNRLFGTVKSIDGDYCRVELDNNGGEVRALKVNIDGVGSRTTLSLRPERVRILADGAEDDNVMEGKVEELIYLGDHVRTRMVVAGNDSFVVKIPNASGHPGLRPGDTTKLGWKADDFRALDAPGGADAPA